MDNFGAAIIDPNWKPTSALHFDAEARKEIDAWIETARQHCRNEEYYRGLVQQIGKMFGQTCFVSDDGSLQEDVLCAKAPEVVAKATKLLHRMIDLWKPSVDIGEFSLLMREARELLGRDS